MEFVEDAIRQHSMTPILQHPVKPKNPTANFGSGVFEIDDSKTTPRLPRC